MGAGTKSCPLCKGMRYLSMRVACVKLCCASLLWIQSTIEEVVRLECIYVQTAAFQRERSAAVFSHSSCVLAHLPQDVHQQSVLCFVPFLSPHWCLRLGRMLKWIELSFGRTQTSFIISCGDGGDKRVWKRLYRW